MEFVCRFCHAAVNEDALFENEEGYYYSICLKCNYVSSHIPPGFDLTQPLDDAVTFACSVVLPMTEIEKLELDLGSSELEQEFINAIQPLIEDLSGAETVEDEDNYSVIWRLIFDGESNFNIDEFGDLTANFGLRAVFVGAGMPEGLASESDSEKYPYLISEAFEKLNENMAHYGYQDMANYIPSAVQLTWRGKDLEPFEVSEDFGD